MSIHDSTDVSTERLAARLSGVSLLVATVLFMAVFSYLAATFDYPDVLDRSAAEVLPRLLALGNQGRAVWFLYGFVPLLLMPTAIGLAALTRAAAPLAAQGATISGVLAAVSMMIGLLRWPSLQWRLALAYGAAGDAERGAITALYDAANSYLGNVIGEFVGELALNTFFVLAAYALARASHGRRQWVMYGGMAVGVLGYVAMFRNVTTLVSMPAEVNNLVLPIWMPCSATRC